MAELLKDSYGISVVTKISQMLLHVEPSFDSEKFIEHVQQGYNNLELMDRGRKIAAGLKVFLPDDFTQAVAILLASLDAPVEHDEKNSLSSFIFLPHTIYISENGLGDVSRVDTFENFDTSMKALYQLTQKFTSEFAIRPFIQRYPDKCLSILTKWATDSNLHVRRLVSEGTRPRLPWASRLPEFMQNPAPVIALLELLKDDPELYVRRSVANNLNDIGKDHPDILAAIAKNWLKDAPKETSTTTSKQNNRIWLVKHALRSAVKRGDKGALEALGYAKHTDVKIENVNITPQNAKIGDSVQISFELINQANDVAALMVDFSVHFIKANGKANPKVFKLKALELAPNQFVKLSKKISLKPMTTRTLYCGIHKVDVIINGLSMAMGSFTLSDLLSR